MQDIKVGERTLAALRGEIIDKEAGVKEILSKPVRWLFKAVGAKEIPATAGKGMPNVLGKSPSKKPKFSLAHATNNTSGIGSTERLNMLGRDELKFPVEKPKLVPAGESNAKASAGPKKAKEPNTLKDTTATAKGDTKPDTSVPDESPEWMKKFKTGKTYKSMQDNPLAWTGGALAAGGIGAKVLFPGHKNEQA